MARIRSIKPEIWLSAQVMALSMEARLLFLGLITQADDEGRGSAEPKRLKAAIFGGDDITSTDVRRWLDELVTGQLVSVYPSDQHGPIYSLSTWKHHQKIDRPRPSGYPAPPIRQPLVEDSSSARRGSDGSDGSEGGGIDGSEGTGVPAPSKELPPGAEGNGGSPPKRRGSSRVPEDFLPDLTYARSEVPDMDAEREAKKFRDWEFKTPRKDWPATWRSWVSRCRETGKYAKLATAGGERGLERISFG